MSERRFVSASFLNLSNVFIGTDFANGEPPSETMSNKSRTASRCGYSATHALSHFDAFFAYSTASESPPISSRSFNFFAAAPENTRPSASFKTASRGIFLDDETSDTNFE